MGTGDRVLAYAFVIAVVAALSVLTADRYGGASYWPSLLATLVAVVLAFEIERRRERRALGRAEEGLARRRETEARKRLLALQDELKKNQESIGAIVNGFQQDVPPGHFALIHPQLLDGTWSSSGERLGVLADDHLSPLACRRSTDDWRSFAGGSGKPQARDPLVDGITLDLAVEMQPEVAELLEEGPKPKSAPRRFDPSGSRTSYRSVVESRRPRPSRPRKWPAKRRLVDAAR